MSTLALVALIGGIVGTYAARRVAWRIGFVSRPNPIVPQHVQSVAYLGGLGIGCGLVAAALGTAMRPQLVLAAFAYLALGTYDDARPLRPLAKLAAQAVIATAFAVGSEVALLAIAWIVVVVNAVNLTDVCDGFVSALAIVALGAVGLASPAPAFPCAVACACAGFWLFNRPPASIFLGDGGSHLLGFAIAAAWLDVWRESPTWNITVAAVLGTAVFLVELGFLVVVRRRRGIPFWRGSPDHLALRLQAAGLSKERTIVVALVPALVFGALSLALVRRPHEGLALLGAGAVIATCLLAARLYARQPDPEAGA